VIPKGYRNGSIRVQKRFYKLKKEKDPLLNNQALVPEDNDASVRAHKRVKWSDTEIGDVIHGVQMFGRKFVKIASHFDSLSLRKSTNVKSLYQHLERDNDPRL
jgi:hypothetical protein